jgi:hypothetical protein
VKTIIAADWANLDPTVTASQVDEWASSEHGVGRVILVSDEPRVHLGPLRSVG